MTLTGFIILFVLITVLVLIFIELAGMPGREAHKRNHPDADAINILGWLGLPLGIFGWLAAMVWARLQPMRVGVTSMPEKGEAENDQPATE